jgi:hypothetical protein
MNEKKVDNLKERYAHLMFVSWKRFLALMRREKEKPGCRERRCRKELLAD